MKFVVVFVSVLIGNGLATAQQRKMDARTLTVATFNVSMESQNYVPKDYSGPLSEQILVRELESGENVQIKNIAGIIQTVRPDVLLLNEFDYIPSPGQGIDVFLKKYLANGGEGLKGIQYPYYFYATVNTGQPTPYDLDNNGTTMQTGNDAWGFGNYPGQYGMVILSRFPIVTDSVRTFQHFKWKDMPGHQKIIKADGSDWYQPAAWRDFPLSSKSHWDVPVKVGTRTIHMLASHPTPPVFDGPEDRNGKRNHDEIRFWRDYITEGDNAYFYDDKGNRGGLLPGTPFVILGDLNASPDEGDAMREGIAGLLNHPAIRQVTPVSKGGTAHSPENRFAESHTAGWRMRADYVLPSVTGLKVLQSGVFWPEKGQPFYEVVNSRGASSDHRLVWVQLEVVPL